MKKLLVLFLALVMSLSAFSLFGCGEPEVPDNGGNEPENPPLEDVVEGTEGLKYSVLGTGEEQYAVFTGIDNSCTEKDIVVASHYKGVKVTEIGLGAYAISNKNKIESIKIHKYVKVINSSAFNKAANLVKIEFDKDCELETIGSYAFKGCAKLESFSYSGNINAFGDSVFDDCPSLKTTEYKGAKYIGSDINPYLILMAGIDEETCVINKDCQVIYSSAFTGYKNLKSVTFESNNTLASIGSYAFKESNIKEIVIPETVVNIGMEAFMHCNNLVRITFSENSKCKIISQSAFRECENLEDIKNFGKTKLEIIDEFLIFQCPKITYIDIPASARIIRRDIMRNCYSLKTVNIPRDSVLEEIQEQAFRKTKLEKLLIPKTVITIRWDICAWNNPRTKIFCDAEQEKPGWMLNRWKAYNSGAVQGNPDPSPDLFCPVYLYSYSPKAGCWRWVGDEPTPW